MTVEDSGVLLTGRLLASVRDRREVDERIWEAIPTGFDGVSNIAFAYPTVRTFYEGPIRVATKEPDPVGTDRSVGS